MRAHTPHQLALANACHPAMSAQDRHRRMQRVARESGNLYWMVRCRQRQHRGCEPSDAMDMLDAYESPSAVGSPSVATRVTLGAVVVLVLLWWFLSRTTTQERKR